MHTAHLSTTSLTTTTTTAGTTASTPARWASSTPCSGEVRLAGDLVRRVDTSDARRGRLVRACNLLTVPAPSSRGRRNRLCCGPFSWRGPGRCPADRRPDGVAAPRGGGAARQERGRACGVGGDRRAPPATMNSPRSTTASPCDWWRAPRRRGVPRAPDRSDMPLAIGMGFARRRRTERPAAIGTDARVRHDAARRRSPRGRHPCWRRAQARAPADPRLARRAFRKHSLAVHGTATPWILVRCIGSDRSSWPTVTSARFRSGAHFDRIPNGMWPRARGSTRSGSRGRADMAGNDCHLECGTANPEGVHYE